MTDKDRGRPPILKSGDRVVFLLVDDFPMITFASALEPLRAANAIAGREIYRWAVLSEDGRTLRSSSGVAITPDGALAAAEDLNMLIVVGGNEPALAREARVLSRLRALSRHGVKLGAISGGVFLLARAGLLDGYRCAVHWYFAHGFKERFPKVEVTSHLFEIDRDRLSCAGGTTALDLMLTLMSEDLGRAAGNEISSWFQHPRIRNAYDEQSIAAQGTLAIPSAAVTKAVRIFRDNIETPCSMGEVARHCGVSLRQLQRLFKIHLHATPAQYYRWERLKRARELLLYSDLALSEIALATGFASQSHFARSYRAIFSCAPGSERAPNRRRSAAGGVPNS